MRHSESSVAARLTGAYRDMAAGDLGHLMELYEPDAVIQSPGEAPLIGAAAIRAFWRSTFEQYSVQLTASVEQTTELADAVVVRGRARGEFVPRRGGAAVAIDSWFLQIYRRRGDQLYFWRGANGPNPER